jgi:RimJ/RimL family protein N-acetyltransferase
MDYPIFAGHTVTLETQRLILRPSERSDFEEALKYYQDPDFTRMMEGNANQVFDVNMLERIGEYMAHRGYNFTAVEKASGRAIGELCLEWMNLSRAEVKPGEKVMRTPLGIWDKTLWCMGYGKEMLQCVMEFAFENLCVDRLCGMDVAKDNLASQGLFKSCGFKVVRVNEGEEDMDFEISRDEYMKNRHG